MSARRPRLLLGVDGGNTETVALLASRDGSLVSRATGGCTDIYGAASADAALQELERTVLECCRRAEAVPSRIEVGVFSLAGADWPEDITLLESFARSRALARRVKVYNDAFGPLRAGSPRFVGASVVCGTGTATGARAPSGSLWHTSWWQQPQGARQLGALALRAAYRAELGVSAQTSLREALPAAYGRQNIEDLLHAATRRGHPPFTVERAAHVLTAVAEEGDEVAVDLIRGHGAELGAYVLAAAHRVSLGPGDYPVVFAGSVLLSSPLLRESLTEAVAGEVPREMIRIPRLSPAAGALLLAFDEEGIDVSMTAENWET